MPKHYNTPDMKLHKKWLRNPDIRLSNKNRIKGTSSRRTVDSVARSLTLGRNSAKKRVGTGDIAKMRKRRSFRGTQKQKMAAMLARRRKEIAANKKRGPAGPNFNPPQREPGHNWSGGGGRRRR